MKSKVTLAQIAAATGVSVNAVSRALNDKSDISDATKEKIKNAAREMGYIANSSARSLRSGKTNTIGVIMDMFNQYYSKIASEVEQCVGAFGYSVIMFNSNNSAEKEYKAVVTAMESGVDGIIICPVGVETEGVKLILKYKIPLVLMEQYSALPEVGCVVRDDTRGGYIAAEHLIELGHTKILTIFGNEQTYSSLQKLDGMRGAMRMYGVQENVKRIDTVNNKPEKLIPQIEKLIENEVFTAVICGDDVLALNVSYVLLRTGKRIPKDVSIVGFGDFQQNIVCYPMLTTITVPVNKLSVEAAEILIAKINNEEIEDKRILPVELKVRRSTSYGPNMR